MLLVATIFHYDLLDSFAALSELSSVRHASMVLLCYNHGYVIVIDLWLQLNVTQLRSPFTN